MTLCLLLSGCSGCNPTSILGPTDKPDFKKMKWAQIEIVYQVLVEKHDRKYRKFRRFTISDSTIIQELHNKLAIQKVGPNNLGAGDQLKITMSDGKIWTGDIVFENRLDLCKKEDNYYSYILTLSTVDFYNYLRELCLKNEQKTMSEANIKNIILQSNLSDSAYQVLPQSNKEKQ